MEKEGRLWTMQRGPPIFRDLQMIRNQQRQLGKAVSEEENMEKEVSCKRKREKFQEGT